MDMETCSYCLTEVEDSELEELEDGARVCSECISEKQVRDYDWFVYRNSRC